jgi:hypothetical protein
VIARRITARFKSLLFTTYCLSAEGFETSSNGSM